MTKKLPEDIKKKRKPIGRACKFCHSKHLQCDPGRPCQNCVKRGLELSCENVERKKTKYLGPNEKRKSRVRKPSINDKGLQIKNEFVMPLATAHSSSTSPISTTSTTTTTTMTNLPILKHTDLNFVNYTSDSLDKNPHAAVAPLEYPSLVNTMHSVAMTPISNSESILPITNNANSYQPDMTTGYLRSNNANSVANPLHVLHPEQHMFYKRSPTPVLSITNNPVLIPNALLEQKLSELALVGETVESDHSSDISSSASEEPEIRVRPNSISYRADTLGDVINKDDLNFMLNAYNKSIQESNVKFQSSLVNDEYAQLTSLLTTNPPSPSDFFDFEINERPFIQLGDSDPSAEMENNHNSIHINTSNILSSPDVLPNYIQEEQDYTAPLILRHIIKIPDDIYLTNVVKSYQYPKLYHALIRYLKQRFNRDQLLSIAKCMATYRPSFISATKSLVENDLIFTEKSFQRSLLEYENLISLSATPTIIWRRTGEIAALTNEFSALTGYTRANLLAKRTFIVELMDDESALRYFKLFSDIAFGDLNATILTDCVLKKADSSEMKCASVWTIKRDVFDIPMLIVGQFLPIL